MRATRGVALLAALTLAGVAALGAAAHNGFQTSVKRYAKEVPGSGWETEAILSVGDVVPETGRPGLQYKMIGIPDGLGAHELRNGHGNDDVVVEVFMNHELVNGRASGPRVGRPQQRGAFVSQYRLDEDGSVLSGRRAYDTVYAENVLVGPAAEVGNATPGFGRLCSGFLATPERTGFDRPIYLAGEESGAAGTFDGRGGQSVAIFDNEAHTLPKVGRYPKENQIVMPHTGRRTVIIGLEDGPATPDSQLYMYVGTKQNSGTALSRNGLDNGRLYVFATPVSQTEASNPVPGTTVQGEWREIPGAEAMTEVQLEVAADVRNAFGFVRIEDGAFAKSRRDFYFVTTGSAPPNLKGRLYHLRFGGDPLAGAELTTMYNADMTTPATDGPLASDNIDVSGRWIVINEDPTTAVKPDLTARNRDGSIWFVDRSNPSNRYRAAELVGRWEGGRDNILTGPGDWETSGIIDVRKMFEDDQAYLFDVQAHPPTTNPGPDTDEDGQLLFLSRADRDHDDD